MVRKQKSKAISAIYQSRMPANYSLIAQKIQLPHCQANKDYTLKTKFQNN